MGINVIAPSSFESSSEKRASKEESLEEVPSHEKPLESFSSQSHQIHI